MTSVKEIHQNHLDSGCDSSQTNAVMIFDSTVAPVGQYVDVML